MSLIVLEYLCEEDGRFDSIEERANQPPALPCPRCSALCPKVLSAPKFKPDYGAMHRGKSDGPPSKIAMDTRAIADGQSVSEWKAERKKLWRDRRVQERKRLFG